MKTAKEKTAAMTPGHPDWAEFRARLSELEECIGGKARPLAAAILKSMGDIDIPASMAYFNDHGGYCDCEILFNVGIVTQ